MRIFFYLFVFSFSVGRLVGQTDGTRFSSIQFVNAASTERLRLQVGDQVWHSTFRPGQKTSAGAFPRLDWSLCLFAPGEGTRIESQFGAHIGKSYTAVIVGDFRSDPEEMSGTDDTNRMSSNTTKVRAKILFLPNEIDPGGGNRLRVVNGLVGTPIHSSIPGSDRLTIAYGEMRRLTGLPVATDLRVEAGDRIFNLSFLFLPPERGCTIAFYRMADRISYVAANEVVLNPDGSLPSASPEAIERILDQFDAPVP